MPTKYTPRNEGEDILNAILAGGIQGFGQAVQQAGTMGGDIYKTLLTERLKREIFPEDIELKEAKIKAYKTGTPVITGWDEEGNPITQFMPKGIKKITPPTPKMEKPTRWDIQKEARTTVNSIINQNPSLQMQAWKDPTLITNMIDEEVERLSQQYGVDKESLLPLPKTPKPKGTSGKIKIIRTKGGKEEEGEISPQFFNPATDRKL